MREQNHQDKINFMAGTIVGALTGAIVALLYAPQSGKETRKQLKENAEKTVDDIKGSLQKFEEEKIKPTLDNLKKDFNEKVAKIKKDMSKKLDKPKKK